MTPRPRGTHSSRFSLHPAMTRPGNPGGHRRLGAGRPDHSLRCRAGHAPRVLQGRTEQVRSSRPSGLSQALNRNEAHARLQTDERGPRPRPRRSPTAPPRRPPPRHPGNSRARKRPRQPPGTSGSRSGSSFPPPSSSPTWSTSAIRPIPRLPSGCRTWQAHRHRQRRHPVTAAPHTTRTPCRPHGPRVLVPRGQFLRPVEWPT